MDLSLVVSKRSFYVDLETVRIYKLKNKEKLHYLYQL